MHELSIAQSLLAIATQSFPADAKGTISEVGIRIGELSGIEIEALTFAFSIIKKDTILENASLRFEIIPGEGTCRQCHQHFTLHQYGTPCPHCKSYHISITGGRELTITNLLVDEPVLV